MYRGIIVFKKGYQPRSNRVKNEKDDLVTDYHSILTRWRNQFSHLFNVCGISDVRQTDRHTDTDIHTAAPLVPEPSTFDAEMAI